MTIQTATEKMKLHDFALVTNSQDVEEILSDVRRKRFADKKGISGLFVSTLNGDYSRIYGFEGSVPYISKELFLIK